MILPGYKVAPTSSSSLLPAISIRPYCNMDESYFVLACEFHQVFCTHSSAVYTVLYIRNRDCEAFCVRRYHMMLPTRTALNRGLYKCMLLRHTSNNSQEKFDLKVFLAATLHLRIRMSPRSVSIASAVWKLIQTVWKLINGTYYYSSRVGAILFSFSFFFLLCFFVWLLYRFYRLSGGWRLPVSSYWVCVLHFKW